MECTHDYRTLKQLAQEALDVQDASNLSGIVHSFSRAISRLRELMPTASTRDINRHPICLLWIDKLVDLSAHYQNGLVEQCWQIVERLAKED
jgi:hypothetical protein